MGSYDSQKQQYCTSCGKPLPYGDEKFCTSCGAPVSHSAPAAPAMPVGPQPGGQAHQPPAARKSSAMAKVAVGLSAAAFALALVAVVLLLRPFGGPDQQSGDGSPVDGAAAPHSQTAAQASDDAAPAESASSAASGQIVDDEGDEAGQSSGAQVFPLPEKSSQSAESKPAEKPRASKLVNLDNADDYYAMNLFLSNFAEWFEFWWKGDFDRSNPDMIQVVNWGFWHYVLNNDTLQKGDYHLPGTTNGYKQGEYGTTGGSYYSRRTDTAGVENAIWNYLGIDCNLSGFSGGFFAESDGYLYESAMRGSASPRGIVAISRSAQDIGGNDVEIELEMYQVEFDIIKDMSWYRLTPAEVVSRAKSNSETSSLFEVYPATAVVHVDKSDAKHPYKLVRFSQH